MIAATDKNTLDLGCGNNKRPGATGVDFNERTDADIIHNLNEFPYPMQNNSYDEIYMDNTLEHLTNVMAVMEEVYRICKPGGMVKIMVPYFRSVYAFIDPTHLHFFTVNSFAYFDPDNPICERYAYTEARFKVESVRFNERLAGGLVKSIVKTIANWRPTAYEFKLSPLFPLDELTFTLRKI